MFGDVRYKRAIDTVMRAGREGERLWFAAVWPIDDLFGRPGDTYSLYGNKPLATGLDHILFVEVYTDEQDRPYSGNCCVVDIWSRSPPGTNFSTTWIHDGVNFAKVSWKMDAEWDYTHDNDKEAKDKWLNVPVDKLVAEDMKLYLFRYTVDEEGFQFAKEERRSWVRHAVRWLRAGVEKFVLGGVGRGPMGTLAYEGEYNAREVVNYFIHIGEG